jgi:hypothetical protein
VDVADAVGEQDRRVDDDPGAADEQAEAERDPAQPQEAAADEQVDEAEEDRDVAIAITSPVE